MSIALNFLRSLIDNGKLADWTAHGNTMPLFKADEVEPAEWFAAHVAKYGKFPALDTFTSHTGVTLPTAPEPPAYYRDRLKQRHRELEIKRLLGNVSAAAKNGNIDWDKVALAGMRDLLHELTAIDHSANMIDFRNAGPAVLSAYGTKLAGTDAGLMLGWPTLDDMSGGLKLGDMISIAGRPGVGKTWAMLHAALYGWLKAEQDAEEPGTPRLFVSMEMDALMVAQRITSMLAHVPFNYLKNGHLTQGNFGGFPGQFEKVKGALKVAQGYKAPFWIIDGNLSSSADHVAELAAQLKPDAVFIDAAYLLKHPTERDRFRRVAENAELIKKNIANAICPVVTSWQLNREASKKAKEAKPDAKAEEPSLDDIAYADAIGQVSSLVLGIYKHADPDEKGLRTVHVLKGRSGEHGEFNINWNFKSMRFDEAVPLSVSELNFYPPGHTPALSDA